MDRTITHLLGYLKPEQWADAIEQTGERERIEELIREQEEAYSFNLMDDVKRELGEA